MFHISLAALSLGFLVGASLIVAIGAQNAFVLRQGLKRQYVFVTATICTLCDAVLIMLGVAGFGTLIASIPALTFIATWGGAAFLLFYGFRSFRSALRPETLNADDSQTEISSRRTVILTVLALSLLNPHVYLDTVVILGTQGGKQSLADRPSFAIGAMLASLTWFFSLAYGATWLVPLFRKPIAWRILDSIIGCVMWSIAISLIWSALFPS